MSTLPTNPSLPDADMSAVFLSSILGTIALIAAFYIVSMALPADHKYAHGWIFGLAWFPILVFAFIEFADGQFLPTTRWRAWLAVLEPYALAAVGVALGHESLSTFLVLSGIIAFAGAFTVHPIILYRENIRGKEKGSFSEIIAPHLFLYTFAGFSLYYLVSYSLSGDMPTIAALVGLAAGYLDKVRNGIKVSWNA